MRILMLALEGFWDTGLAVTLDAFKIASNFAAAQTAGALHFDVSIVGVRKKVRSGQGFPISVKPITSDLKPDWVIVPALNTSRPEQLIPALERRDVKQATEQLRSWYAAGACIAASCIGTFVLAEAGLLDGREATTTWWLSPLFRQRYPNVRLDETRMLVTSDRVVTAGAAMGHLDLALWFIRQASPEVAAVVSRYFWRTCAPRKRPSSFPTISRKPIRSFNGSNDGRARISRKVSRCRWQPTHWRRAHAPCSAAAKPCSANHRFPISRTFASNARNPCFTAAASTSMPSPPRSVTRTEQRCGLCCANG